MKFGKQIQSNQIPGWSSFYLDYKGLKKIVSSLEASYSSPPDSSAATTTPLRPSDVLGSPSPDLLDLQHLPPETQASISSASSAAEDDRGPVFQAHKARFFYKLERELEKINKFYLQKEAELKSRLTTLLVKRQAAARRFQDIFEEEGNSGDSAEWRAVEEGFRLLEKDLGKLQQFIEINATGFRKILKKWDKRSKSRTKELYLARQVEIQPCFNRQLLAELSDTVATCLLDLSNPTSMDVQPPINPPDPSPLSPLQLIPSNMAFRDLETNMTKAITLRDETAVRQCLVAAERLSREPDAGTHITRILWKAAIEAEPPLADIIMASNGYDIHYVDDINGRTCIHGAAVAGELRLLDLCIENGLEVDKVDFYGRTALHYASMNGHDVVCQRLLTLGADPRLLDKDNYTPLIYAVINGNVASVRALLEDPRVGVDPLPGIPDLIPLSLACQHGHVEAAALLLQRGAQKIPNTNGQYPLHLAAREGHADVCRMLLQESRGVGKDVPDKYSEWTPVFHAARHGHESALRVLLEAGCNPHSVDEAGTTAVFYSAWYGYIPCVELLLRAMEQRSTSAPLSAGPAALRGGTSMSPMSDLPGPMDEPDTIPSLSLPPPIMPFRIYGHNYLDKTFLLQIVLGQSSLEDDMPQVPAVELFPSSTGLSRSHLTTGVTGETSLKLVVTPKSDATSAPHAINLPLLDQQETLTFSLRSLDDLAVEFSFYPTFGSKAIGRAVVLPGALRNGIGLGDGAWDGADGSKRIVLPILDHRLHVIGQVSFEACIITPLSGVKLEVGGTLETYWKSTAVGPSTVSPLPSRLLFGNTTSSVRAPSGIGDSGSNSPVTRPGLGLSSGNSGSVIFSSLTGEYIHVTVQMTRDLVPVVYSGFKLPVNFYDLGVADMTLDQFLALAKSTNSEFAAGGVKSGSSADWRSVVSRSMMTLDQLLKVLPIQFGACLELVYPSKSLRRQYNLGRGHQLNGFVDSILKVVFNSSIATASAVPTTSRQGAAIPPRRKVVFASFDPNVCVAVNWKQPNYAVFFASDCGLPSSRGLDNRSISQSTDLRQSSLDGVVNFAKANNFLGILINASLLVRIPSLVPAIKDSGVLLAAFGVREELAALSIPARGPNDGNAPSNVDAILQDGILSYVDHSPSTRASI